MNDKKFFLKFGLLGILLKTYFADSSLKNSHWKMGLSVFSILLPFVVLLFLVTGKIDFVPLVIMIIISIFYGLFIKKQL